MRIAVCDDNQEARTTCVAAVEDALVKRGLSAEVVPFVAAEELLVSKPADLYFLDILMPGKNGIQLGAELHRRQPGVPIVYLTSSRDYAVEAIDLGAVHYLVKPYAAEAFAAAFDRAWAQVAPQERTVTIRTSDGYSSVAPDDLYFAESDGHYQRLYLKDGRELVTRMSGSELFTKLAASSGFVRAGHKAILSLRWIREIRNTEIIFPNGHLCRIPRLSVPEIRRAHLAWCS